MDNRQIREQIYVAQQISKIVEKNIPNISRNENIALLEPLYTTCAVTYDGVLGPIVILSQRFKSWDCNQKRILIMFVKEN